MEVCVGGALKVGETFICEFICERVLDVFIGKGKSILDKKKFEKQFIEIGNFISSFERQEKNGFVSDFQLLFSEDNMKKLGQKANQRQGFSLGAILRLELQELCGRYEINQQDSEKFINQFLEMILNVMAQHDADKAMQMFMGVFKDEVIQKMDDLNRNQNEMMQMLQKMSNDQATKREVAIEQIDKENSKEEISDQGSKKIEWNLQYYNIEGIFGSPEKRKEELLSLPEIWKEERAQYPNWYVLPQNKRQVVSAYTKGEELLQYEDLAPLDKCFDFAYELLWRYEVALMPYSYALQHNSYRVWKAMYDESAWKDDEQKKNWFHMGFFFCREYREELDNDKWEETYQLMSEYSNLVEFGIEQLAMAEIEMRFAEMKISETVNCINKIELSEKNYGDRLKLCAYKAECGMFEEAFEDINILVQSMRKVINDSNSDQYNEVYLKSLFACCLHLKSYFVQANDAFDPDTYKMVREIDEERESLSLFYSYEREKEFCIIKMLNWMDKNYPKPLFDLNREIVTILGTPNYCREAYSFYRVLDKSGLPLHIKNVRLLKDQEHIMIDAIMEWHLQVGWYLLLRSGEKNSVKKSITRTRLINWDREKRDTFFKYVYNALDHNMDIIKNYDLIYDGNIYTSIASGGLEILKRVVSVTNGSQQMELLFLMKRLIESDAIKDSRALDSFITKIMEISSEKCKVKMLNPLLTCSAQKRTQWAESGQIDPFDVFGGKELALPLYQQNEIESYLIDNMFVQAQNSEDERKAMIARLGQLYEWGKLSGEQIEKFAKILWGKCDPETQLPDLKNYYTVVYLRWPHPVEIDVKKRVQDYLINENWRSRLCNSGLGISGLTISYWDQIRLVNQQVGDGFWDTEQLEKIILLMHSFWKSGIEALRTREHILSFEEDTFRKNYRQVIRTLESFATKEIREISDTVKEKYLQMLSEMREFRIPTMEAEIPFLEDDQKIGFINDVVDSLYEMQKDTVVSAAMALQKYWMECCEIEIKNYLCAELAKVIRAGKEPGLLSFLVVAHNMFYQNMGTFTDDMLNSVEKALVSIEKQTAYSNNTDEVHLKKNIEIRCQCAALAYQLYLYENVNKECHHSNATFLWKKICCETDEFTEVKNVWLG